MNSEKVRKGENETDFFHSEMHLLKNGEMYSLPPRGGVAFSHEMRINI
jgi:hypothetical protein